jgi:ATP-dependent protease ClpP protease subunit
MRPSNIRCSQSTEGVELAILGDITPSTAEEVMRAMSFFKGMPVTITMMSGGGDAFASLGLYDYIKGKDVTVRIYGIAASGAAIISAAARRVEMAASAFLMIHNAYGPSEGSGQDVLDSINARQVEVFASRSGMTRAKVQKMLDAETFMDATTAKENGFADAIFDPMKMAASLNNMTPMSDIIKDAEVIDETGTEPVVVTDAEVAEAVANEEAIETEEVEVEIPVTVSEAIQAGLKGRIKAKVNVAAKYGEIVAGLLAENKAMKAQLDEANAAVEALQPAAAEAEAAKATAAEATAKVAEVVAEVEALKATPIEPAVVSNAAPTGVVPAGEQKPATEVSARAQGMAKSLDRLDRAIGNRKN